MAIRYSVQADTKAECLRGLQELCEKLGAHPVRMPTDTLNSWLARAVPAPPADQPEPGHE